MELTQDDIRTSTDYEQARGADRKQMAEFKRHRRINIDHRLSLVFENRETIRHALEEVVRAERITDPDRIAEEVASFNAMVPNPGELSACLYIEVADPIHLDDVARELNGIGESVVLSVAGHETAAKVNLVDSDTGTTLAYQILFVLTDVQRDAWRRGDSVVVKVFHPACQAQVELTGEQRDALASDLGD